MQTPTVLPPHYFLLSLVLLVAVDLLFPTQLIEGWPVYLGVLPVTAGLVLALAGANLFKRLGTNIIPLSRSSTLVQQGVFRFSRNPMYLGMLLCLGGLAWLLSNPYNLALLAGFFAIIRQQFVLKEEALMEATFGAAYLDYKAQVRRWI